MFFTQTSLQKRSKTGRHFALALALATGSVVAMSGMVAEPAHAQKKKKKKSKAEYSETFIAAYNPINEALKVEGADINAVKAQIPGLIAAAVSADEQNVTGNTVYLVGGKAQDQALQFDGMKMMLASGKIGPEKLGQYNFIAFQLARALGRHSESRPYLQGAIDNNFTSASVDPAAMRIEMAETFFREDLNREGLASLTSAIEARKASGQAVDETWYRRGLSVSFNNKIQPEVYNFLQSWIGAYPSQANWRDAVNITRQLNEYGAAETLDLMRLGFRKDTLQDKVEYLDYVESADARRLPKEVQTVIQKGYSTGIVSRNDSYLAESLEIASGRIAADRAELPSLERDARSGGAGLRTVMAAGDAFLSYGQAAKAEEFYTKALGMGGADTGLVLTRLGIAQSDAGKQTEAQATFAKVQGSRRAIAQLWSAYAAEKAEPAMTAAAAPSAPEIVSAAVANAN